MTTVRALHTIYRNPLGRTEPTGELDADGRPRTVAKPDVHQPGDIFGIDDSNELLNLLSSGSVEIVTEGQAP